MKAYLVFLILGLASCGVDPGTNRSAGADEITGSASSTIQASQMAPDPSAWDGAASAQGGTADPQTLNCFEIVDCDVCGVGNAKRRDVWHRVCSDGSDVIFRAAQCGTPCT
jgi:hypothetical protein